MPACICASVKHVQNVTYVFLFRFRFYPKVEDVTFVVCRIEFPSGPLVIDTILKNNRSKMAIIFTLVCYVARLHVVDLEINEKLTAGRCLSPPVSPTFLWRSEMVTHISWCCQVSILSVKEIADILSWMVQDMRCCKEKSEFLSNYSHAT